MNLEPDRFGYHAKGPSKIPIRGWFHIFKRVYIQLDADHLQVVAAGVAFYFFLSLFPLLGASISIYGLMVDPNQVFSDVERLEGFMPQDIVTMLTDFLRTLASQSQSNLSYSLVASVLLSLWSVRKGVVALFAGINIAYNEHDTRSFIIKYLLTYGYTILAFFFGILMLGSIVVYPLLVDLLPLPQFVLDLLQWGRWLVLAGLIMVALAFTYKWAPHRRNPQLRWVSIGSAIATGLWLLGSYGFSYYIEHFSSYNQTYGSFAAVIITLLWLLLTAYVILLGAEINSEMEHQTSEDTTVGPDRPMGERNAVFADQVAGHPNRASKPSKKT